MAKSNSRSVDGDRGKLNQNVNDTGGWTAVSCSGQWEETKTRTQRLPAASGL